MSTRLSWTGNFSLSQTESWRDEAIIRNVIHLANYLSAATVAEGSETEQQLEFLKSLSCDIGQEVGDICCPAAYFPSKGARAVQLCWRM